MGAVSAQFTAEARGAMGIEGLAIIGESINDSVPSTRAMLEAGDVEGILRLAESQDAGGAAYIDVNVGRRTADVMAEMVRKVQGVTAKPLSIDTPDPALAEAGLKAYDRSRSGGKPPILNSISPLRMEMLDLFGTTPFMPILLISERVENGSNTPNGTAAEIHATAKEMLAAVRARSIPNGGVIFDPGIAPAASDMEGMLKRTLDAMALIHADPDMKGVHMSVGLSNFTHMLPSKRSDGTPVRSSLESAFLTRAMPLGLDMIVGSVKRKYEILPAGHPALACLEDLLSLEDIEAIERVREFYSA